MLLRLLPSEHEAEDHGDNAGARGGIDQLTTFAEELSPTLRFITPAQSVCFYGSLLFYNLADTGRLVGELHEQGAGAHVQIAVAPC